MDDIAMVTENQQDKSPAPADNQTSDVDKVVSNEDCEMLIERSANSNVHKPELSTTKDENDEDELEEGELKDDDDDDEDEEEQNGDVVDGPARTSGQNSDDSDIEDRKRSNSTDSRKSSERQSSKCSSSSSEGNATQKDNPNSHRGSSSSIDRVHKPDSFSSRHDSKSRHSSRSESRSRRLQSPSNNNHQARLVTMRAKLLEAKSREIEMKFQKHKVHLTTSSTSLSVLSPISTIGNLKTTLAKPSITYAENPNPMSDISEFKTKFKVDKQKSETKDKSKSSKKVLKRKKKKSSPKKKKKRIKTSDVSRKGENSEKTSSVSTEPSYDNIDHQGPKTPPDNQVLTLDDEQVEWPSYLIKMTTTLPSISYSVNPDSVAENNATNLSENHDLSVDYSWYYNYLVDTFDMDKLQAQNQACSILIALKRYDKDVIDRWLAQQGFSRQSKMDEDENVHREVDGVSDPRMYSSIPIKSSVPQITTLRSQKEIILPNGKVLPRGTIQKIVHPYPRTERVVPDFPPTFFDLH